MALSATHVPSSAHAPEAQSASATHARHVFMSQTGLSVGQSFGPTQPTQPPDIVSQTMAPGYDAHWLESVQPSHAFVTTLQTGCVTMQPSVEHVS
jgi:hypothetical protein